MSKTVKYQNPNFDKDRYWRLKGKKQKKEEPKVVTPGAPLSIIDGDVVSENRAATRARKKGRKYSFYHRKGYQDELGAIKIKRSKNGVVKYKLIPVTIDKP